MSGSDKRVAVGGNQGKGILIYRGKASVYGSRAVPLPRAGTLTTIQVRKPMERDECPSCGRMVALRNDGTIRGHNSRRGISCPGAVPRGIGKTGPV